MLEYVLLALVGCAFGVVTGLTPGLHVNTVCLIGLSLYAGLGLDALEFGVVMVAMSVTHTFLDFIPGIFLGVPNEDTALSILPAHQLVLRGKSLEAVKLTCYGCLLGLVFGLLFLIPAVYVVPAVYNGVRGFVVYLIAAAAALLVLREGGWHRVWAAVTFTLSGLLGLVSLHLDAISNSQVLFPVFSGLFGLSGMIYSLRDRQHNVPQNEYANVRVDSEVLGGGLVGALCGMVVGVLPAMSPSQVGILASEIFGSSQRSFLVSLAAINASDAVYSLMALYMIQNGRSGVSVMLGRIIDFDHSTLVLFVGVFCLVTFAAVFVHIEVGKRAMRFFNRVDYRIVSLSVMSFVLALVWFFTGCLGLLVAVVSSSIGLLPILSGVSRTHLMGVLLVPTIFYFLGLGL